MIVNDNLIHICSSASHNVFYKMVFTSITWSLAQGNLNSCHVKYEHYDPIQTLVQLRGSEYFSVYIHPHSTNSITLLE